MKKMTFSLTDLLHNRKVMVAVSVVLAVVVWYLVMSGPANIQERTLTISAAVDLSDSYAETIGLRLTGAVKTDVNVTVRGQWSVISRLSPADLRVRANVSSVQKAGQQDVPLTVSYNSASVDYDIISISPNSVSISCDYWKTEKFRVQVDSTNLSAKEGMQLGKPILDAQMVSSDGMLTLSGPKTQLDRIQTVVANIAERWTLEDVERFDAALIALDANGGNVPLDGCTINGQPVQTISVTVPVWVAREIPLSVTLQHAPAAFDTERVTLTPPSLLLLGPADTLAQSDIGEIGTLDFDTLSPDTAVRELTLELPDAVQVVSGETAATVRVEMDGLDERRLTFTSTAANVEYINNTTGKQPTIQPRTTQVCLVGEAASLQEITADDLRLSVDLTNASVGTAAYSARYRVEGHDDVWVYYGEEPNSTTVYVTLG